jgi:hypothetical protein
MAVPRYLLVSTRKALLPEANIIQRYPDTKIVKSSKLGLDELEFEESFVVLCKWCFGMSSEFGHS